LASTGTYFILVIGSDARPGEPPEATRGDSLHIVGVNPARGAVSILGIPRDSFVPIPGVGTRKINEALLGGPDLMVRTVERLTGVAIDGYVLTGFAGFQDLVNAVGGIGVNVPYRMSDPYSQASFRPGMASMLGRDALAFSRDRHDVPGGDFGRSMNQGRLLIAALRQLKLDVAKSPAALLTWLAAGAKFLHTDLGLADMAELLLSMPSLDPGRVENRVVSGTGATIGGLSVVQLGPAANATFRDLAADAIFNGRP
ncbi:MAG: LCP family protein, partial [Actinomycetota bacterium]